MASSGETEPLQADQERVSDWANLLTQAGAVGGHTFGVQLDLNAAWRQVGDESIGASFCDHNCTAAVGNYTCLAALTLNPGVKRATLAPAEAILGSVETLEPGIEAAQDDFFEGAFREYCEAFRVPPDVAAAIRLAMDQPRLQFNVFGGNPERHPGVTQVIRGLLDRGHEVHLTTTGGRFMTDRAFTREIQERPPSLIALSADDFDSPEDIRRLAGLSLDELHAAWSRTPALHGQRRKAHEAVYVAKLAREVGGFPPLLFNMVLHAGNIDRADDLIAALTEAFPGVQINPFPAQSAFSYDEPALEPKHAGPLRAFTDRMIETQLGAVHDTSLEHPFVPRLHYWLMLRAVFDWAGDNHEAAMRMITGDGIWQCYRSAPAGFYVQVGLGAPDAIRGSASEYPGGHLGCFWNRQTVTDDRQVWTEAVEPRDVTSYIQVGKSALAAASPHPCPGCAFPRLTGHILSTEMGMDPQIVPYYLARRALTLGF